MLSNLLNFLFPKNCVRCRNHGDYLCSSCLNYLPLVKTPICPQCLKPSPFGITHPACFHQLNGLICPFDYSGFIKPLITSYKYRHIRDYTLLLTDLILTFADFSPIWSQPHILIPVPLHQKRQRQRGYNQSALLAESLSPNLHWPYLPNLLIRSKATLPQKDLNPKQRHQNLSRAFSLSTNLDLSHHHLLLIDDIFTTGTTLRSCASALQKSHPLSIWSLTFCKPPHPSDRINEKSLL